MAKHILKIEEKYLDALISGKKTFERRINDRNYKVGDVLNLQSGKRDAWFFVDYIEHGGEHGLHADYVLMGVKRINTDNA